MLVQDNWRIRYHPSLIYAHRTFGYGHSCAFSAARIFYFGLPRTTARLIKCGFLGTEPAQQDTGRSLNVRWLNYLGVSQQHRLRSWLPPRVNVSGSSVGCECLCQ